MKKHFKVGSLLFMGILMIFSTVMQGENIIASAAEKTNSIDEEQIMDELDQETIDIFEEIDKYLIEREDGTIEVDEDAAISDGIDEEVLEIIKIVNNIEEDNIENVNTVDSEDRNITTYSFKLPIGNYGRYCGWGNKGGTPIDDLDRACKAHDSCFLGLTNKSAANKKCNLKFVKALLPIAQQNSAGSIKGAYARAAIYVFKKNT